MKFNEIYREFKGSPINEADSTITDWKSYVDTIPMLKVGIDVLYKIEAIGKENDIDNPKAYIVGGTIRDIITGDKEPDDIDIATNVPVDILEKHFNTHDIGKNKDFGIIVIHEDGFEFEIANFRKDGEYSDGRRPDDVEIVMDYKDDAERRDLTINAMAVDADGNVIDHFDGNGDIKNKIIRTVGDPEKRFSEDYIRMLRAVRFASRMDFTIDDKTMKAIQSNSPKLKTQASERIMKEVIKMAKQSGDKFADAIVMLNDAGLLQYIFPEIVEMDSFEHSVEHHPEGNVLQHTLAALRSNKLDDYVVNLAILLHDVGKIRSHHQDENGMHRYFGHAKKGVGMIDDIANRLKMTTKEKRSLQFAAEQHMKMHDLLKMKPANIMKLVNDPNWDVLQAVAEADARSRGEMFDEQGWFKVMERVDELKEKYKGSADIKQIKKLVGGKLVMDTLGVTKGNQHIGNIVKALLDWVINNDIDVKDMKSIKEKIHELNNK